MKWLWIACPDPLWRRSCSTTCPNGTFPITRSYQPSGSRVTANDSARIRACGYSAAAIPAVTGSSSTPVTWAPSGARPMKFPDPQPGSSTRPPVNPSLRAPSQITAASAASV